jgi:hypothetical protein
MRVRVRVCLIVCIVLFVGSSHRQQFYVAWRKDVIPHKPKRVIRKATTHDITPMPFYKLTEIIGIDDMCLHTGIGEGARP